MRKEVILLLCFTTNMDVAMDKSKQLLEVAAPVYPSHSERENVVVQLLEAGARRNVRNAYGLTAEDIARVRGCVNIANMIRAWEPAPTIKSAAKIE